jgi:hypothetical protein
MGLMTSDFAHQTRKYLEPPESGPKVVGVKFGLIYNLAIFSL